MTQDLDDLTQQSQDNLINFLRLEIQLADTYYDISRATTDSKRLAKLQRAIQAVVKTIHQFSYKISDPAIRRELSVEADQLEEKVLKVSANKTGQGQFASASV